MFAQLLLLSGFYVGCVEVERALSIVFDHALWIFFLGANVSLLVAASRLRADTFLAQLLLNFVVIFELSHESVRAVS